MNKHIELVKKWLDDPSSVTVKELKENAKAAAAYAAADAYDDAANAAYAAADAAADAANAAYFVKKYEELVGE
jgi:hypothetical protein